MINYKPVKKAKELVEYLEKNKNVCFNEITKTEAIKELVLNNYINIVTPFKHLTADRDVDSTDPYESCKDKDGKHIYSNQTDFIEYYKYFELEREEYKKFYHAISKFEMAFKSLVGYEFLEAYSITNSDNAKVAFQKLQKKVNKLIINSTGDESAIKHRKTKMIDSFNKAIAKLDDRIARDSTIIKATDIYVLLDRLGLQEINNIYMCLRLGRRNNIFNELSSAKLTLGALNEDELSKKVFNLVTIRNTIMHFNSMEILLKFRDYKTKDIRSKGSREDYNSILTSLRFISRNI